MRIAKEHLKKIKRKPDTIQGQGKPSFRLRRKDASVQKNLWTLRQLQTQFKSAGISVKRWSTLLVDLADIYSETEEYRRLVAELLAKRPITKRFVSEILTKIEVSLYGHIYWHMKELSKKHHKLIGQLGRYKASNDIRSIFKFR